MKVTKKKRVRSVVPVYVAAGIFVLCGVLFPIYEMWAILLGAVLAAAGYAVTRLKFTPDKIIETVVEETPDDTGDSMADEVIRKCTEAAEKLVHLNDGIKDPVLFADTVRMEDSCRKIADAVREKPQKARLVKRFLDYYLPTALKLLDSYVRLKSVGTGYENVDGTAEKIEDSMSTIATAFEKQVDSMYADEALDITTDIEVLESMLQSEGLSGMGGFDKKVK